MSKKPKKPKTASLVYEQVYLDYGRRCIIGIDEAGRGAWAGPVAAGAVYLPLADQTLGDILAGVRDSKQMTARQRGLLVEHIKTHAIAWGVGSASSIEIDMVGINPATKLAMRRALEALTRCMPSGFTPDCLFLDSIKWEDAPIVCEQVHLRKGDQQSLSIAAASVLAKTWRDEHMLELEAEHPGYAFAQHKGYGTLKHRTALEQLGPSPVHRMYYKPLQNLQKNYT